jgi:hypothetical protein
VLDSGAAQLSIASWLGGAGRVEASGWPISVEGRLATRANGGLAGAKRTCLVSMCQMASARLRATSTRATAGPRCLPTAAWCAGSGHDRQNGGRRGWQLRPRPTAEGEPLRATGLRWSRPPDW